MEEGFWRFWREKRVLGFWKRRRKRAVRLPLQRQKNEGKREGTEIYKTVVGFRLGRF